jgi:hypothetical protein
MEGKTVPDIRNEAQNIVDTVREPPLLLFELICSLTVLSIPPLVSK